MSLPEFYCQFPAEVACAEFTAKQRWDVAPQSTTLTSSPSNHLSVHPKAVGC